MLEGSYRYRFHHNVDERRRIRMALYTAVPGIFAYAARDGVPIMSSFYGLKAPEYPLIVTMLLDVLVLLPAFGLVYAIARTRQESDAQRDCHWQFRPLSPARRGVRGRVHVS
jgi:hypothetical protein